MREALTLLALVAACTDYGVGEIAENESPSAGIAVDPEVLFFGELGLGLTETRSFEVLSTGSASVTIDAVEVRDSAAYTIWTDAAGRTIPPGGSLTVAVTWTPLSALDEGRAVVESNARNGLVEVALTGTGLVPELEVEPDRLELDSYELAPVTGEVCLTGAGPVAVEVTGAAVVGGSFQVEAPVPFTLEPGEEATLPVTFVPTTTDRVESELWITADTPTGQYVVDLVGTVGGPPDDEDTGTPPDDDTGSPPDDDTGSPPDDDTGSPPDDDTGVPPIDTADPKLFIRMNGDDGWEAWMDGEEFTVEGAIGCCNIDEIGFDLAPGSHVLAVHVFDIHRCISGFIAAIYLDDELAYVTSGPGWVQTASEPSADWTDLDFDDSAWSEPFACASISPWRSYTEFEELYDEGAEWVWWTSDCTRLGEAWFRLEFEAE